MQSRNHRVEKFRLEMGDRSDWISWNRLVEKFRFEMGEKPELKLWNHIVENFVSKTVITRRRNHGTFPRRKVKLVSKRSKVR